MNKFFNLLVLILVLNSCSSIKTIHTLDAKKDSNNKIDFDHVDFKMTDGNEKSIEVYSSEETLRVGDNGGSGLNQVDVQTPRVGVKKLKIGLSLGPGIYRTVNYIPVLKILERQNLNSTLITGTGFGAIIAAMYASGMTPEVIEWNFYKYFKEKKRNKLYDQDWINEIDKSLLLKFKDMNIQDTKKKFFITLYDHNTRKTYYFDKGNIRDLLLLNLRLSNNASVSRGGQKYSAPFEKEVFNARLLRQLGADFTIALDALGSKFDFENTNEYLIGIYGGVAGHIQKEKKDYDFSVTLPVQKMNLDSTKDSAFFMQKSFDFMLKQLPTLQSKIQAKIDSLANLGIEQ